MPKPINNITKSHIIPASCTEHFLPVIGDAAHPLRQRGIVEAGISELYSGYEIGRPNYPYSVIIFTLNGKAQYETSDTKGTMTKGQLMKFPAHAPNHYWVEDYWEIFWFHFEEKDPWSYLLKNEIQITDQIDSSDLLRFCRAYYRECVRSSEENNPASAALSNLIGIHLDRILLEDVMPRERETRAKLNQLWQTVNSQLSLPWTVRELAKNFHLSEAQFRRTVLEHENMSPRRKIITLRMERTKQLLIHKDYTLDEIAERTGYDSAFSLSRIFKKETGLPPSQYRKQALPKMVKP